MARSLWHDRSALACTTPDIIEAIKNSKLLIERFGGWPDFDDAEIISLTLDRGNLKQVFDTQAWSEAVRPSLTAVFCVFGFPAGGGAADRKADLITIRFTSLQRFSLDGFNYQNPIVGMEIIWERSDALNKHVFAVDWGGTFMHHEASFTCEEIEVIRVERLPASAVGRISGA